MLALTRNKILWVLLTLSLVFLAACEEERQLEASDDASLPDADPNADADLDPDPELLCTDTCQHAGDGECDDGGPGADYNECDYGTDCTDCGPRPPSPDPDPEPLCTDTCQHAGDGECDDGGPGADYNECDYGTDCTDCGPRPPNPDPDPDPDPVPLCTDTCEYAGDGDCDDGGPGADYNECAYGTDCTDCGPRPPLAGCTNDGDCGAGQVCNVGEGRCVAGAPNQGESTLEHVLLTDAQAVADAAWETSFTVPDNVRSLTLIVELASSTAEAYVWTVHGPNNQLIYDIEAPSQSSIHMSPWTYGGQMGVLFPNTPQASFTPGSYKVKFWSENATQVKVHALLKRGSTSPQGGRLPVTFWFTEQDIVNAQTAQTNAHFQHALAVFREVYGNIGIELEPVRYRDIGGTIGRRLAVPQSDEQLCADVRQVATTGNLSGLNLILFDHYASGGYLGMSCGIPGAPSYPGIMRSGATVALAFLEEDPDVFGETIAHEGGHFMGLFHTSESDGRDHDPLADTPQCTRAQDSNGDGSISAEECINHGADNNMFWTSYSDGSPQRQLTNNQRFVLMNNPLVETY